MFFSPSPALPSWASTLLRDNWQEEEGLDLDARWLGPGELNSLLTVPPVLDWAWYSSPWHFPAARAPCSHTRTTRALWEQDSGGTWSIYQKFSLALCYPFNCPTSFLNTQILFQACSFSLVGWLRKHERFMHLSLRRVPKWKRKCFSGAHSLLGNERHWKNNCVILALKENIHYGPFGASLRWAGTLRLIPARQWTVVFVGKGVLNRGEGSLRDPRRS